ncbi:MAG: ATP-binding protein [Deltaproteobacteria bacterium]|nr:MAG: ATP-binding protein [Deltaproteobacteria bacterium]
MEKQKTYKDARQMQEEEIKEKLSRIKYKLTVMSGKGGVGKSSIAAYLAVLLSKKGYKVGLMDIDLHGPSIPRLLGLKSGIMPSPSPGKAFPVKFSDNLEVISIETLMGEDKDIATIWRGPIKIGVIRQFIADIEWSDPDFLIIDSPPGTGDEPLTVAQTISDSKAIIVTTPQEISLADVRKSINFCEKVNMEIVGIIENMSGLICPYCGKEIDLFKKQGGEQIARAKGLVFLGRLPLDPKVVESGDMGDLSFLDNKESSFTKAMIEIASEVERLCTKTSV